MSEKVLNYSKLFYIFIHLHTYFYTCMVCAIIPYYYFSMHLCKHYTLTSQPLPMQCSNFTNFHLPNLQTTLLLLLLQQNELKPHRLQRLLHFSRILANILNPTRHELRPEERYLLSSDSILLLLHIAVF